MKHKNHKKEPPISQPTVVMFNPSGDAKAGDERTMDAIESLITNPIEDHDFDCMFLSATKESAENLSQILRNTLGYVVDNPYKDVDGWLTRGVIQVNFISLQSVLNIAREEAAKNSSTLDGWIYYVAQLPSKTV